MFHLKSFQIFVWGLCTRAVTEFERQLPRSSHVTASETVSFKCLKRSINSGRADSTETEPYRVFMLPFRLWHVLDYCRRDTRVSLPWHFVSILTLYSCQATVGYIVVLTSALLMNFAACHPTFQSPLSSLLSLRGQKRGGMIFNTAKSELYGGHGAHR